MLHSSRRKKKKLNDFKKSGKMQDFIEYKKRCAIAKKTTNEKKRKGLYNFIENINKSIGMSYV